MGDVGAVAKVIDVIFSWWTSEAGRLQEKKRKELRKKKEECQRALHENRWDDLRRLTAEYERLSNAP